MMITALVLVSCLDDSQPAPGDVTGPALHVTASPGQVDTKQDTYLNQTDKDHAYGDSLVLSLRESAKNRILVEFDEETITGAGNFLDAVEFGRVFLTLTIAENPGDWGENGRYVDLHRMTHGWTAGPTEDDPPQGATWNCAVDQNLSNQRADCEDDNAWDVGPSGHNPWETDPTASTKITTGQGGDIRFDVTDDIEAFANGTENVGWVLMRRDEVEQGGMSVHSFENLISADVAPRLESTVCPPNVTCGETLVNTANGNNDPFTVAAAENNATIVQLDVTADQIDILIGPGNDTLLTNEYPDELIFSLQRVDEKCLGHPDPSLEVGPCWEAEITDPADGTNYDAVFKDPQLFTSCVLPGAAIRETALADVVRQAKRSEFDPNAEQPDAEDPTSVVVDPLTMLEPSARSVDLDCEPLLEQGRLDHLNPVMRFARALWSRVTRQVSPRPLQASTMVTTVGHHRNNSSDFPEEESFLAWTAVQIPYSDGGYTYLTVGRKCESCPADRVPRGWFKEDFVVTAEWQSGVAAFGGAGSCPVDEETIGTLAGSIVTPWESANPNFNPPAITELLLRKEFKLLPFTGEGDVPDPHPGTVYLEVRAAVHNDIQVYLDGMNVTEHVFLPDDTNLKRSKGWITSDATCPEYDQIIVRVPEHLVWSGSETTATTHLLGIRARSRDLNPAFLDVQVNVIEP
jgi:hypothetical protein